MTSLYIWQPKNGHHLSGDFVAVDGQNRRVNAPLDAEPVAANRNIAGHEGLLRKTNWQYDGAGSRQARTGWGGWRGRRAGRGRGERAPPPPPSASRTRTRCGAQPPRRRRKPEEATPWGRLETEEYAVSLILDRLRVRGRRMTAEPERGNTEPGQTGVSAALAQGMTSGE